MLQAYNSRDGGGRGLKVIGKGRPDNKIVVFPVSRSAILIYTVVLAEIHIHFSAFF